MADKLTQEQLDRVAALALEDVVSVYSGKPGKCCCGCAGNHRYALAHVVSGVAAKSRGYAVDADEVNDRQVRKVLRVVQENIGRDDVDAMEDGFASVVVGGRLYIVYPKEA